MDKEDVVYIYYEILLSHKKEWNIAILSNMDGPRDYHTKWSKSYRERQISYDISYMWNLNKEYKSTYLQNRKIHRHRKQTYVTTKGEKRGEG